MLAPGRFFPEYSPELDDDTVAAYLCSTPYNPGAERGVTLDATDPISKQTDFKKCAVKIQAV